MGCHQPDTELSRLNRVGHLRALPVDPWTYRVFQLALAFWRISAGAFDCTIGARQAAAGRLPARGGDPGAAAGSSSDIDLSESSRVRYRGKLYVDLGGIAKGFAVDRAVDALRRAGATAGVVNAGGDLRAFGASAEPVHVRLERGLVSIGEIQNAAVATSCSESTPPPGLPILDGRSARRPVARLVSVFAAHCVVADALTKIVALRGARSAAALARCGAEALCREQASGRWSRIGARAS